MIYVIGVSAYYHDSSACLFKDGELIFACEEEKFTGVKHDSSFPINTIDYIFKNYELKKSDIECVCYYENPKLRLKRSKSFFKSLINNIKVWYNLRKISNKVHYTSHHMSHMTYSYLSSNFNKSIIVSVDGVGETSTVSIGKGINGKVYMIKTIEYPHSLGLFYSAMTAFLGFKPNEGEYKVMGLASYGNPNEYRDKVKDLIKYEHGSIQCNMNYFTWNTSSDLMFNYTNLTHHLEMENRFHDELIEEQHKNLASSIQERYEEILFNILKESKEFYFSENLCLGGGCAYNGTANGKIIENGLFKKIWIPPAPSDAGSSIGSCLDYLTTILGLKIRLHSTPFLGPDYSNKEILQVIKNTKKIFYLKYNNSRLLKRVSKHLYEGKVVGWFQGKIEFGSRALGNRSILANPTILNMKDKINSVIKKREGFRPFAPMVTFDTQTKYFETKEYIPYMNQVVKVKSEYIKKLPAVTHIDGTARIQSVTPHNPIYQLLKEFENRSGYPILLNTSFNIKDKTMVLTPQDAMNTFLDTKIDILVLGNYVIYKK